MPPSGNVTGTVTRADGSPAVGFLVLHGSFGSRRVTATDANGQYTMRDLPAGPTTMQSYLEFSFPVITTDPQPVTIVANQTVTRNFNIPGYGTISVLVRNVDLSPAVNVEVVLTANLGGGTTTLSQFTDAAGMASFTQVYPGAFTLRAHLQSNFQSASPTFSGTLAQPGDTFNATLTMNLGTLSGHLSRPNGAPAVGDLVQIGMGSGQNADFFQPLTATADAAGNYSVANIPVGEPFGARFIRSDVFVTKSLFDQVMNAATQTLNATMLGAATLHVAVLKADGSPFANATLEFTDSSNRFLNLQADAAGIRDIVAVREGAFSIRAVQYPGNLTVGAASGTIMAADDGTTINVTIRQGVNGTVRGTIFATDGATPAPRAQIDVIDVATGLSVIPCLFEGCSLPEADDFGNYQVDNVAAGTLGFRVTASVNGISGSQTGSFTSSGQSITANITVPVSIIKGTVFLFDGATPVPSPNVFAQQGENIFYGASDPTGHYVILGAQVGPFELLAQDATGPLIGTTNGTLASAASAVAVNVLMQPSGTVTGQIRTSGSAPVANALVGASSELGSTNLFNVVSTADAQGNYQVSRMPLGVVVIQGQDPANGVSALSTAALTTAGQSVTLNVALPATGTIQGAVFASNGITRIPNAGILVQALASNGPLGNYRRFSSADGSGNYVLSEAPVGPLRVVATDPINTAATGLGDGTLTISPTTINVQLGNFVPLSSVDLTGADGFHYIFGCVGQLESEAYSYAYEPPSLFPCLDSGVADVGGRQITYGPVAAGGLVIARKVFVPAAGKFARYIEVLSNPSGLPITTTYNVGGYLSSSSDTRVLTAPATTSNRYAVTDSISCCFPVLGHVFAGSGAPVPVVAPTFTATTGSFSYGWQVTIPAGQTVALMHFALQRQSGDEAGATALAQALAALTDSDALTGLSPGEKAQIRNFIVP